MLTNVCVVKNAYHAGTEPMQTAGACCDALTWLPRAAKLPRTNQPMFCAPSGHRRAELFVLVELLRQTGVGALPLGPPQVPDPRADSTLVEEETRSVQAL